MHSRKRAFLFSASISAAFVQKARDYGLVKLFSENIEILLFKTITSMALIKIKVFFYGLFMDSSLLYAKGVLPDDEGSAQLPGYTIRIGNRATLIPEPNKNVYGMLMSLTHPEIDLLYAEESLKAYRPEPVIIHTKDERILPALCFNLIEPPAAHERNQQYADKLKLVAIQCGLPEDYVNSIN